jgi:hypothetical protein
MPARLARGKGPVPNAGWSGNQTGVMAGRAAVASASNGHTATTERGPPEHPRRSVALQNTHDGAWPSRTPTTKCGPPEHPRPSAALQNTEKCGHDGAWPSKITRRVRPRRSVALRVALQHARSAQTLHDVTQYSAGQGQAACRTGLSECSSERCNPLTGAYHFARLAPGSRWPHGSSQDVTCQRQV